MRTSLDTLYGDMEALLDEISDLYLGPVKDIDALRLTYEKIQKAHGHFLDFSSLPSSSTDMIAEYEEVHLYPLYDAFEEDVAIVMAAGMDAHIGKPLDINQLCSMLNRLCSKTEQKELS